MLNTKVLLKLFRIVPLRTLEQAMPDEAELLELIHNYQESRCMCYCCLGFGVPLHAVPNCSKMEEDAARSEVINFLAFKSQAWLESLSEKLRPIKEELDELGLLRE